MTKILTAQNRSIILWTLFIMLTGNLSLFRKIFELYPLSLANFAFLLSLAAVFTILTSIFFLLICHGRWARWVMAFYLLAASQAAYYMDQYGVILDNVMIDNMFQTNPQEFAGLISTTLVIRTLLLGILPAWLVLKYMPTRVDILTELKYRAALLALLLVVLVAVIAPFTAGYASFIREHKIARLYANPTYFTHSIYQYLRQNLRSTDVANLEQTASDATMLGPREKFELIVLVVGESARADRFSLNGYAKDTNPELRKRDVVSLTDVASCATSTGESVPCMFSVLGRKDFDRERSLQIENVLDVLAEHGVQILWRDNNSDSKGTAVRMQFEDFRDAATNPVCDPECRDVGMLSGLDSFIESKKNGDILIVLHQMGNHGPEYYRRYPKEFERFKPTCKSNELSDCTKEEIDNAYDNAILYTDYFLSKVIDLLKKYDGQFETAMLYVSDHGESLGEYGIYLHAAPYFIAPKEQTHIPAVVWLGKHFDYTNEQLKPYKDSPLSHDDLFCMLMVGYELSTDTCAKEQAILLENLEIKGGKHKQRN
ncbi:MAG: phosphoethanolamine--lipid A transferase [Sideroxyarcus sp.]|nr:phosphoethanolamine--lipid A transferase [Sideroxyarcus sp.]